ncbi:hypothetical protein [Burkholderia pseudomallei]|uniref:hypothetical protein n=1 Tax=Burkholderia pseudomallei TaxID=28450 RepID=UPI003D323DD6
MLDNLVGSAIIHGNPTAAVQLTDIGCVREISIAIRNRGPAIPPFVLYRVFEPLGRDPGAENAPGSQDSLGLGLYMPIITAPPFSDLRRTSESDLACTTLTPFMSDWQ